jgi:hypothetical protein
MKQSNQRQEEEDYSRPVSPISSSKADCEIKCLADKEAFPSLKLNKRKKFCRIKCADF